MYNDDMNLNQLNYFRVLAKTQHYGKASEILHISQPSLSKAISLLEEELHVTLFEKDGRNIKITYAGEIYLEYVKKSLDSITAGNEVLLNFSNHQKTLSIGVITPFLCENALYSYISSIIQPNPNYKLSMKVSQSNTLLADLKLKKYDFVISSYSPYEPTISFIPVMERKYVVCMRKDDPLSHFDKIRFEQLQDRNIVLTTETLHSSAMHKMFSYYHFTPNVKGVSNEDCALVQMVNSNIGLLITSDHKQLHDENIIVKEIDQTSFHRYIYLAYEKNRKPSELAEKIITYAKKISISEENH